MTPEQKNGVCNLLNILIALADKTGMKDIATEEIIEAAASFGIDADDLLRTAKRSPN